MRPMLKCGVAVGVLCAFSYTTVANATSLDDVMRRLNKLEKSNAKLQRENRNLRKAVGMIESGRVKVRMVHEPNEKFRGNPVGHVAVATGPAAEPLVSAAGVPIITKSGWHNPFIDATTINIYGHIDVSADLFNVGVWDQNTKVGIASNLSYLGFRIKHDLAPYGFKDFAVVGQIETEADISQTPSVKAAFGSRDSYIGLATPWGAIKAGKMQTPYKTSTAAFDPFSYTVGDYNSIMGNTGGDARAEFDYRAPHAIWYESPVISGFQAKAMASPGQNQGISDSDFPYGEYNCSGGPAIGNGSGFPGNAQGSAYDTGGVGGYYCNDGSFGTLYSASLTYHGYGLTAIAAYELHLNVNRTGDIYDGTGANIVLPNGVTVTGSGIGTEWAAKAGLGYTFNDGIGVVKAYGIFEHMEDDGYTVPQFNERDQNNVYFSATQSIQRWDISVAYAHSFGAPGSPITLTVPYSATAGNPGGDQYASSGLSSAASLYAAGVRYNFSKWASIYLVGADLANGPGAHNCLGPSGHGYSICSRDAYNNTYGGANIWAMSSGLSLKF
ncbi:MAG: porin [Beijerinckiaceae bacterium]|nr:MAG: porin [Beijerinckiaceae bacterium]